MKSKTPSRNLSTREASPPVPRALPEISPRLLRLFSKYSAGYLRRHFHSVRLLQNTAPDVSPDLPLVVYLNHSSWWDPLVCLLLSERFFPHRRSYAPIDAQALRRYRFFRRLGFFGVETGTAPGATSFLQTANSILQTNDRALWLTPQGKFVDPRKRPLEFQRGVGHLAANVSCATSFLPLAIESVFWEERLPEILVSFGEPIIFRAPQPLSAPEATRLFESALASAQDYLAAASQRRQPNEWRPLLTGRAGVTLLYDFWRRTRARLRGKPFDGAHSDL